MREMFNKITRELFGDSGRSDRSRPDLDSNFIADILPYRVYDKRRKLFFNRASVGFIIELSPFLGADEKLVSILTEFMSQAIPEKTHMQILNWASPRIGEITKRWLAPRRKTGGVYGELGLERARHIDSGAWNSLSRHAPFFARNFRTLIAVGIEGSEDTGQIDSLLSLRDGLLANLASLGVATTIFAPDDLIGFLDEIINMSRTVTSSRVPYTATDPINIQIAKPDTSIITEPGRLLIETITESDYPAHSHGDWQSDSIDVRCYSAPKLPSAWAQWKSARLIGDPFNDQLRFPCPVLTVLCLSFPDQAAMEARAGMKAVRSTQQSETPFAKYNPTLHEIAEDWKITQSRLKEGEKLVRAAYFVMAFAGAGEGDEVERTLRSLYKAAGWSLAFERFVQLPTFTAAFPLSLADGLGSDLKVMKRLQTRLTSTCVNIAPLQGEYLGFKEPHLMLLGRRGQPFFLVTFRQFIGQS
ncbi:MAG: conjugal transfer protein TraC [Emcibacter sp.]|nr:conjugal transfer protein TraC [Emcibacter sp.]